MSRLEHVGREWLGPGGVPTEHVVFAHGALDLIGRLLSAELRPGDAMAMEDPDHHHLLDLVSASGLRNIPVAVDGQGLITEALREALWAGVRTVVCSPRAESARRVLLGGAPDALVPVLREEPEVLVVENDHASAAVNAPLHALTSGGPARWVYVRPVSKCPGSDLRWAAAVCDPATSARHDGRMLLTSGWVRHLLRESGRPGAG